MGRQTRLLLLRRRQRYIDKVRAFIIDQKITSILEIGCGDFHVAGQILKGLDVNYLGGDVVESLINHHRGTFQTDRIHFKTINAIEDVLPVANLIIIRQVLQHLSNEHIQKILKKLPAFKYALITEHLPASAHPDVNVDKITGPHIRMKFNSGVFITEPPFNVAYATPFLEYPHDDFIKGKRVPATLRTYLVTQPA